MPFQQACLPSQLPPQLRRQQLPLRRRGNGAQPKATFITALSALLLALPALLLPLAVLPWRLA